MSLGWPSSFIPPEDAISVENAWALGAWAGDGDCTHFRFINPDDAVIEKLRCYLNSIDSDLKSIHSTRQKQAVQIFCLPCRIIKELFYFGKGKCHRH